MLKKVSAIALRLLAEKAQICHFVNPNCCKGYDVGVSEIVIVLNATSWTERIDAAIAANALVFHCQPIYRLYGKQPELFEVLCRLTDPVTSEIIPAARFMHEVTEEQWKEIDRLAVVSTLEHLKQTHIPHAINLSAPTLNDLQFPGWLSEQLKLSGVLPSMLMVELSEESQINAESNSMFSVKAIRSLNLQVGLDDWTVGFSNIPALLAIDPDFIKVDGSTVRLIGSSAGDAVRQAIVFMCMAYCYYRRCGLVLEFVENGEILMQIQKMAEYFPMLKVYVQGHFELFGEAKAC